MFTSNFDLYLKNLKKEGDAVCSAKVVGPKPCGNSECSISTGICGSLTFGSGRLDDYGYWAKPCYVCRDAFRAKQYKKMMYRTPQQPWVFDEC